MRQILFSMKLLYFYSKISQVQNIRCPAQNTWLVLTKQSIYYCQSASLCSSLFARNGDRSQALFKSLTITQTWDLWIHTSTFCGFLNRRCTTIIVRWLQKSPVNNSCTCTWKLSMKKCAASSSIFCSGVG